MKSIKYVLMSLLLGMAFTASVHASDECVQECIDTGMACQEACSGDEACITQCQDEGAECSDSC